MIYCTTSLSLYFLYTYWGVIFLFLCFKISGIIKGTWGICFLILEEGAWSWIDFMFNCMVLVSDLLVYPKKLHEKSSVCRAHLGTEYLEAYQAECLAGPWAQGIHSWFWERSSHGSSKIHGSMYGVVVLSLCYPRNFQESSPALQGFGAQPSSPSSSHICTWPPEKPQLWAWAHLLGRGRRERGLQITVTW